MLDAPASVQTIKTAMRGTPDVDEARLRSSVLCTRTTRMSFPARTLAFVSTLKSRVHEVSARPFALTRSIHLLWILQTE